MNDITDKHLQDWIRAAGYSPCRFLAAFCAEEDVYLEGHFTAHAGHFEEYVGPHSTVIVGARGSGKTANCFKLAEALHKGRDVSNFVLEYDARAPRQATGVPDVRLEHHLREIIRCGIRQLLDDAVDSMPREAERQLWEMEAWCQEFHLHANYLGRLSRLRRAALDAGYNAVYLLIDERQSSEREPVRTAELLSPLLNGDLFDLEGLYLKLFVPNELTQDAEDLHQAMGGRVQIAYLHWTENSLAELLRALLRDAWERSGSYLPRAEELGRLALLMPDIDRALTREVAANAPTPRGLMRLGRILFAQCARRWTSGRIVSITPEDWKSALMEWHRFLTAEELVYRPVTLVPFSILFTACKATQAEASIIEPSAGSHTLPLPYKCDDLWAVLWALEQFTLRGPQLPPNVPHVKTLRRLGFIERDASQPTLVNDLLERVGEHMYQYLFVKSGLDHKMGEIENEVRKLREGGEENVRLWLELRFSEQAADLARFPWELLYHDVFLLQTGYFELTRYHCVDEPEPILRLNRPLSMLYIAPRVGQDNLSYDRPRIEEAFRSSGLLQLKEVCPPCFGRLMQEAYGSNHQAFHYDDHGTFRRRCSQSECPQFFPPEQNTCPRGHRLLDPQGYLQFDDGHGDGDPRSAADILHALYDSGVQLALVNACKSSAQAAVPEFGGIAPALIRAGVPAVVGMLTSIDDDAAGIFVKAFYKTLCTALESRNLAGQTAARILLQAVREGRRQMFSEAGGPTARYCWWIPSLSLRAKMEDRWVKKLAF